jgi:hypothetical protein
MATVKWGVIGAGGIAVRRTIPGAVEEAKTAKLVALMDVRREAQNCCSSSPKSPRSACSHRTTSVRASGVAPSHQLQRKAASSAVGCIALTRAIRDSSSNRPSVELADRACSLTSRYSRKRIGLSSGLRSTPYTLGTGTPWAARKR